MLTGKSSCRYAVLAAVALIVAWATVRLWIFALADIYDWIGEKRLESNDYKSAASFFSRSIDLDGSNPDFRMHYARSLYTLATQGTDTKAVLALLQKAAPAYARTTELAPAEGNAWFGLAQTKWWLSKFKGHEHHGGEVESLFLHALKTDQNNGKFLYALVDYYLATGKTDRGADYLEQLGRVFPEAWEDLEKHPGWNRSLQDRFVFGLNIAASNRLTEVPALSVLAALAAKAGEWEKAAGYVEQSVRQNPENRPVKVYFELGCYQLLAGRKAEAKKSFLHGLRYATNRPEILDTLLWRLFDAKVDAADVYVEVVKDVSGIDGEVSSASPFIRGKAYFYLGRDFDNAEASFRQAIRFRDNAASHRFLAEIAMQRGDWGKAELESNRATMLDPRQSYYHYLFARSLQEQRRYAPALDAIRLAIKYAGRSNGLYYDLQGWLYWGVTDYSAAIQAWESARQADPKSAAYARQIGQAHLMLKNFPAAENSFLHALKLDPGNSVIRKELQAARDRMRPESAN